MDWNCLGEHMTQPPQATRIALGLHSRTHKRPQHAKSLVLTPHLTLPYHTTPYLTPAFAALEQCHTNPLRRHGRLTFIHPAHSRKTNDYDDYD
jgi:hypothetical protein